MLSACEAHFFYNNYLSRTISPYPENIPPSAEEAGIKARERFLPVTIIEDGYFSLENLQKSGKNEDWLVKTLAKNQATISGTFLLTVDKAGKVTWIGKEATG